MRKYRETRLSRMDEVTKDWRLTLEDAEHLKLTFSEVLTG
jgi:hypothetical protein